MEALGTIEVIGLCAGFEAADVAVKSANVELIGYELAKGGGLVTIKVMGQVGAVNSAIAAAAAAAAKINRVVSTLVIPRPSNAIEPLIRNANTVGYSAPKPAAAPAATPAAEAEATGGSEATAQADAAPATDAPAKKAPARKAPTKPAAKKAEDTTDVAEASAPAKANDANTTTRRKQS